MSRRDRRGFTLYEVVLALAILLGSMAVLSNLIATGSRAANGTLRRTEAVLLCRSKLSEVVSGIEPMISTDHAPFDSTTPDWVWSLSVLPGPVEDLIELQVTVKHIGADDGATVSLRRYVPDPQMFEEAAAAEATTEETDESGR